MSRCRSVADFIPVGGEVGQALIKASADDYDTEWSDSVGSGSYYGDTPPVDPKVGDFWYKTTASTGLYLLTDDGSSQQWVQTNGAGTKITTTAGLPVGGEVGQKLEKASANDFDTQWSDEIDGGEYS